MEDHWASSSVISSRSGVSRVSSPEPVQIPSKIRSVVIQDPPTRSTDNDRRGGSRSQPSRSQSVSVVPEAAVDEDDEEDIWSTPNASPDRNCRRSRSRSRGAADRRLSRSVSRRRTGVAQVKSSSEKREDPKLDSLNVLVQLTALRRRHHHQPDRPPARAISLKTDKGQRVKERVTVHLTAHHLRTEIGSVRTQETMEMKILDRPVGTARKRSQTKETRTKY